MKILISVKSLVVPQDWQPVKLLTALLSSLSPEWVLRCAFRDLACAKRFPHWSHMCNFSPVWILTSHEVRFFCETLPRVNCFFFFFAWITLHWSHVCGFYPVWILIWSLLYFVWSKCFLHWGHESVWPPAWILMCFRSLTSRALRSYSGLSCFINRRLIRLLIVA